MVKIGFTRGQLLDVTLLGVSLVIPPGDFTLFDTDWIINGISGLFAPREDIWAKGDANRDGLINENDLAIVRDSLGFSKGEPGYNVNADFNNDGKVDISDLSLVGLNFGLDRRGGVVTQFITASIEVVLGPLFVAVPTAVWNLAKGTLDSWAEDFFKAHSTYEEYVKEREQQKKEE